MFTGSAERGWYRHNRHNTISHRATESRLAQEMMELSSYSSLKIVSTVPLHAAFWKVLQGLSNSEGGSHPVWNDGLLPSTWRQVRASRACHILLPLTPTILIALSVSPSLFHYVQIPTPPCPRYSYTPHAGSYHSSVPMVRDGDAGWTTLYEAKAWQRFVRCCLTFWCVSA